MGVKKICCNSICIDIVNIVLQLFCLFIFLNYLLINLFNIISDNIFKLVVVAKFSKILNNNFLRS
jgi:hypothetical protein